MSDGAPKDRAAYFRERAAEARAMAEKMSDYGARKTMMEAADLWDGMARHEEKKPANSN